MGEYTLAEFLRVLVITLTAVSVAVVVALGILAQHEQYKKNGIGALIDQQHQKYQQERKHQIQVTPAGTMMKIPEDWGQRSKTQSIKKFEPASGQKKFHLFGGTLTFGSSCDGKTSTVTAVKNGYKSTSHYYYLCLPTFSYVHYMY